MDANFLSGVNQLREEHILEVFNKAIRKTFDCRWEEGTREQNKLHQENLRKLSFLSKIIGMIKFRKI